MLRLARLKFIVLGFLLIAPALYAQEAEDSAGLEVEKSEQQAQDRRARIAELRQPSKQEREARRTERQRQIDSLSDEQRQAIRERQRIRETRGAGQRGQRQLRRRPPASPPQDSEEAENEESA